MKRIVITVLLCLMAPGIGWVQEAGQPGEVEQRLQAKVVRVQAGVREWEAAGRDLAPVAVVMKEFERQAQAGRPAEAEAALDRAMELLADPEAAQKTHQELISKMQQKMEKVKQGAQEWEQAGRDVAPIGLQMKEVERCLQEGRPTQAETALDRALELLADPEATQKAHQALVAGIEDRIHRIQEGVRRWQESGRDPAPVGREMQKVEKLLQEGRIQEAQALLSQILEMLE